MATTSSLSASPSTASPDSDAPGQRMWHRRPWLLPALLTTIALLPLLVLLVKTFTDGTYPAWGDDALLEFDVRAIGQHAILLGPYSRFGFRHPGPMLEYLLAIPYWVRGGTQPGLNLGAGLINLAAIATTAWIAWRRGRALLLSATLLALGAFVLQRGMADDFLYRPWNPYVTVLPFASYLFVCWELSRAQRWALPVACVIASFLVQSHLGYIPVVGGLGVIALALAWKPLRRQWRSDERTTLKRSLALSAGIVAVLWSGPAIETLVHWPGNLARIASFQVHTASDHTLTDGITLVARSFGNFPASVVHTQQLNDSTFTHGALLGIPVILLALAAAIIAWRCRASDALRFGTLVAATLLIGVIALSRVVGPIYEYLARWVQIGTIAALLFPIVVLADPVLRDRWLRTRQITTGVMLAGLFAVTSLNTIHAVQLQWPAKIQQQQVTTFTNAIRSVVPNDNKRVIFAEGTPSTWAVEVGVGAELQRHGYTVRFQPSYKNELGERNVVRASDRGTDVIFGTEVDRERLEALPGAKQITALGEIIVFQTDRA